MTRILMTLSLALLTGPAAADLFTASGAWTGDGRLATGPDAPLRRGRCQVEVTPGPEARMVDVIGRCAVAAGMSELSLKLVREPGGALRAGIWTAATGQVVQYSGRETASAAILTSTAPLMLDGVAWHSRIEVTWPDPDGFAMRQLMRSDSGTDWHMVAEMHYRPAAK